MFNKYFPENRTVYEIMCNNYGTNREATDDNKIRRMHCAWWTTKATDSHTKYVTHFFSKAKMVTANAPLCYVCT